MKRLTFLFPVVTSAAVQFFCLHALWLQISHCLAFVFFFFLGQICVITIMLIELAQEWAGTKL